MKSKSLALVHSWGERSALIVTDQPARCRPVTDASLERILHLANDDNYNVFHYSDDQGRVCLEIHRNPVRS